MKHKYFQHLLIALLATQASFVSAQSIQLQNMPGVVYGDHETYEYETPIGVTNVSNTTIEVIAKREEQNLATGHVSFFCWDLCYSPDGIIGQPVPIAPGETVTIFKSYLRPDNTPGNSSVRYSYYNAANIADSVQYTVRYSMGTIGISELSHLIGKPYPNPSANFVSVDLQLPAGITPTVEIVNVIGKTIKSVKVEAQQKTVTINTADLAPGIYFVRTLADNKTLKVQKFTKL